ncbi:hypothetical protein [Bombilactobacillus thymidiniphilus]|uniref:Uncharacterized protein n=1 Tax=Bombilactobacillus thymidiniphilus TaxID=2923363 RepID=A0ABY4PDF5_9LACO|nr:hypothetical protein [Bombilactobacillus thymidiniphilus]UQS83526.1 hypothetical protein MOO47_07085 [Bombilactobacillus thymidiniphilus]
MFKINRKKKIDLHEQDFAKIAARVRQDDQQMQLVQKRFAPLSKNGSQNKNKKER